ncbi:PTS transporter subunit EIIC [Thermaerobacter subterraneus]|uniref:Glucose/maltose/N-acetylglucosamine-specific phosphotransferase system IIC component n=1 Tax=Thermaerobacter subterraneus DSM 13965 TaxID=867903 RepID=K6P2Y1_9FIRM|nr:PTS transporter subunit EIIC [Thermaerobacter subterraneus]EKP95420.1 glucose/maltose/N-acetylglucosamine-specific phosphotransferase system IIC component [Thermaerobacter subterraneus DSM 13965]
MNVMGGLQRVGRALMAPVAVLPAAGILLRLGQPDLLNIPVMAQAGDAIFSNLPLLFAIGVGIGLANQAGVAGLAALVGYVVFQKTLTTINEDLNMGVLAGILTGALAAAMYNRYHNIRLPEWLGFFGGRRFVPLVTAFWALVLGVVFGFVWGPVQQAIDALGNWIVGAGAAGVFVFGVLNRLLLPFGLHHIINSLVWFVFGDFTNPQTGEVVHGDLHRFFAGDPSAGIFMAGWYPIMMFGLIGVALAMIHEAKPENRAAARGILLSAALTSFVTGITEPLEFAFMFLTPVLYITHAVLSGISMALVYELGIRHGFTFSAGLIDYVLNWGIATQPALLIPIGLVFGVVYYFLFRFLIRRLDLPTPGREPVETRSNPQG